MQTTAQPFPFNLAWASSIEAFTTDGKCFFYPSTAAPQFRREPFPYMGMAIAAGLFVLWNSLALR
jgi:hypothetical protein